MEFTTYDKMLLQAILLSHDELSPVLKQLFGALAKLRKAMGRRIQDVKEVFTSLVKQINKVKKGGGNSSQY